MQIYTSPQTDSFFLCSTLTDNHDSTPRPHHSVFTHRMPFLLPNLVSKHWTADVKGIAAFILAPYVSMTPVVSVHYAWLVAVCCYRPAVNWRITDSGATGRIWWWTQRLCIHCTVRCWHCYVSVQQNTLTTTTTTAISILLIDFLTDCLSGAVVGMVCLQELFVLKCDVWSSCTI